MGGGGFCFVGSVYYPGLCLKGALNNPEVLHFIHNDKKCEFVIIEEPTATK